MIIDPLVCYVVPTLGRNKAWLRTTLASIQNQGVQVDLRVVAPAEADIEDIVTEYKGVLVVERGKSLSEAINQGFAESMSQVNYFAWLGDDDVLAPGSLKEALSVLEEHRDSPFVFGRLRYIDEDDNSKWVLRPGRWAVPYAKFGHNFIGQPGSLIRKDSFNQIGGLDVTLKNSMDQDMFLKLSRLGKHRYISKELASFRVHPNSISSTKGIDDEMSYVSEQHRTKLPFIVDILRRVIFKVTDRILLSVHCRIPNRHTPTALGHPYYKTLKSV